MALKVLIAPLHWGLGHTTRCISIIRKYVDAGDEVVVAVSGGPKAIIKEHFPSIECIEIPFMTITYPANGRMARHFFRLGPKLIWSIWKEHNQLKLLQQQRKFDLVISDSRFGLWVEGAKSVFITHQLHIKSPVLETVINRLNRWIMNRYDEIWIPDYKEFPGLAGELSHAASLPVHAKYIGPLSRFSDKLEKSPVEWKAMAIISGPEPQRSLFEAEIAREFFESDEPTLIVSGRPENPEEQDIRNLRRVNHLNDPQLLKELACAERVISRSGYSTIMDFHVLGIKADYYPTPGQTEQEYLAALHQNKKGDQS